MIFQSKLIVKLKRFEKVDILPINQTNTNDDRIKAPHNSSQYGRISVMVQYKTNIQTIIDNVNPKCFYPSPQVNSSVLSFTRKNSNRKIWYNLSNLT